MTAHGVDDPVPPTDARQRRAWRILVAIQLGALGLVVVAVVAVWLVGLTGGLYGHR